jgi:mannosylglycoprotein endo-beta-mannosidase
MRAILHFNKLHVAHLQWINSANIVLLPKKDGAEEVNDYRPNSLIHAIAKIIAKMLVTRLAPFMNDLVSNAQSAFIKKRSIHDNFMYVRNLARRLHKSKIPTLLFKLDIRKAFDSVSWEFILELLKRHGFPPFFGIGLPLCFAPPPRGSFSMASPARPSSTAAVFGKGTPSRPSFLCLQLTLCKKSLSWPRNTTFSTRLEGEDRS